MEKSRKLLVMILFVTSTIFLFGEEVLEKEKMEVISMEKKNIIRVLNVKDKIKEITLFCSEDGRKTKVVAKSNNIDLKYEFEAQSMVEYILNAKVEYTDGKTEETETKRVMYIPEGGISTTIEGKKVDILLPAGYDSNNGEYKSLYFIYDKEFIKGNPKWIIDAAENYKKELKKVIIICFELKGNKSLKFLKDKIIPEIETKYKASKQITDRWIMGCGNAGVTGFDFSSSDKEVFSNAILIAPDFDSEESNSLLKQILGKDINNMNVWIDGCVNDHTPARRTYLGLFEGCGLEYGKNIFMYEAAGERDNEKSFRNRFIYPILLFLNPNIGIIKSIETKIFYTKDGDGYSGLICTLGNFDSGIKFSLYNKAEYYSKDIEISTDGTFYSEKNGIFNVKLRYGLLVKNEEYKIK